METPRSKHWHELDLIITKRDSLNCVCNTRGYHSADWDTDHSLIALGEKVRPKKLHHSKQKSQPLTYFTHPLKYEMT